MPTDTTLQTGFLNVANGAYFVVDGVPTQVDPAGASVGDVLSIATTSPLTYEHTTPTSGGSAATASTLGTVEITGTPADAAHPVVYVREQADTLLAAKAPLASPALTGTPTVPTAAPGTNTTQAASTAFVAAAVTAGGAVTSVFTRTGAVVAATGDYTAAQVTNALDTSTTRTANTVLAGPTTGSPAAPTWRALVAADVPSLDAAKITTGVLAIGRLASGTPTGAKFVRDDGTLAVPSGAAAATASALGAVKISGTPTDAANPVAYVQEQVDTLLALKAPLASPALTGTPTAPTQSAGNNSTRLATTAYVDNAVGTLAGGISVSTIDAKGDLLVGTADNTVGRLAAGTDGYVLTADSAQTAGLKWALGTYKLDPDRPPTSPTLFSGVAYDKEFYALAVAGTAHGGTVLGTPSFTPAYVDNSLKIVGGTSGSVDLKGVEFTHPGVACTMTAKIRRRLSGGSFLVALLGVRAGASGSGNMAALATYQNGGFASSGFERHHFSALTTRSAAVAIGSAPAMTAVIYMQLVYDGTNVTYNFSLTGHPDSFALASTETATAAIGAAPGRWFVAMDTQGATAGVMYVDWVRFT